MTKNSDAAAAILGRNFLFRDLPQEAIEKLASIATRRQCAQGEIVFSEGDSGDTLYGVVSGSVRVSTSNADGKQVFLNVMEYGDVFGEIAVLDNKPRTATAQTAEEAVLLVIRRPDFLQLLHDEPSVAIHLLRLFCQKLRWTTDIVHEAALLSMAGRVAKRLLTLAETYGHSKDGDLELRMSQADLASFLGVTRQIVNQYLQEWREAGWIELGRSRIRVIDTAALGKIT